MNTENNTVIVLIERNSGYVWGQGETLEAAQAEAFRNGGLEPGQMVELPARDAAFTAYEVPAGDYEAHDGEDVVREGRLVGHYAVRETEETEPRWKKFSRGEGPITSPSSHWEYHDAWAA